MIYEIRLYTVMPGRIDVALERFEKYLPHLFERHGIRNVGRWTATAGGGGATFIYMMIYSDLAERERQWLGFYRDEEWLEIRRRTQGNEEATERFDLHFLRASAAWTPAIQDSRKTLGGLHDLIFAEIALGKNPAANAFLADVYLPLVQRAGAEIMLVADFITGPALPKVAIMFAWPDISARTVGWRQITADAILNRAIAEQRRTMGRALVNVVDVHLLDPTPFALPLAALGNPILSC